MPKRIRVRVMERLWDVVFSTQDHKGNYFGKKEHGECDAPDRPNKTIRINSNMKGQDALETIIHEFLHACAWMILSEEWITQAAHDIAKFIYRDDILDRCGLERKQNNRK